MIDFVMKVDQRPKSDLRGQVYIRHDDNNYVEESFFHILLILLL